MNLGKEIVVEGQEPVALLQVLRDSLLLRVGLEMRRKTGQIIWK